MYSQKKKNPIALKKISWDLSQDYAVILLMKYTHTSILSWKGLYKISWYNPWMYR